MSKVEVIEYAGGRIRASAELDHIPLVGDEIQVPGDEKVYEVVGRQWNIDVDGSIIYLLIQPA